MQFCPAVGYSICGVLRVDNFGKVFGSHYCWVPLHYNLAVSQGFQDCVGFAQEVRGSRNEVRILQGHCRRTRSTQVHDPRGLKAEGVDGFGSRG